MSFLLNQQLQLFTLIFFRRNLKYWFKRTFFYLHFLEVRHIGFLNQNKMNGRKV